MRFLRQIPLFNAFRPKIKRDIQNPSTDGAGPSHHQYQSDNTKSFPTNIENAVSALKETDHLSAKEKSGEKPNF